MPSKDSVDLVIEPRWVLPIAPANTVLSDHAVAVTAGRIVAVAPTEQINASYEPRERVVRSDHALLPGFVNAHTRAATTLLRGLPVYGPRAQWMRETVLPVARSCMSPDFVREGTQLALAEMLRAGITAFSDMYLFPEEVARAASAARMRAAIGLPVTDGPTVWAENATGHLAKAEQLWDEYRSHPGVSLYFAPHSAFGEGDQTLARVRRVADELDARVAMYLAPGEVLGHSPLRRLKELGLLGPGFTAIQLAGLDEEELEIAATTGVCVVACQQSHLRLGGALCPVAEFEARGVTVGLGSDSALSVGALDVLGEARMVALTTGLSVRRAGGGRDSASSGVRDGTSRGDEPGRELRDAARVVADARGRVPGIESGAGRRNISREAGAAASELFDGVSAETALRLATLGGATAIGMGAVVGSIEVGKAADLVCFDLSTLPCQAPRRPADAIVFAATRDQVSDVWISGRAAVANGHLLTFDEQELGAMARRWAERISTGVTA
jgi:5-methylthioadenosine/S-adenosylhomocysteine deaminase